MPNPVTLAHIAATCRAFDLSAARFGREAVGDPHLVRDLRNGRELRPRTKQRIAAYIERLETDRQNKAIVPELSEPPLRPFIVYSSAPDGCIAVRIPDSRSMPHARRGEIIAVDPEQREPIQGELFVMVWRDGRHQIVEAKCRRVRVVPRDGSPPEDRDCWFVEWHMRTHDFTGNASPMQRWADGPYTEAGITAALMGRVVGLIEPENRLAITRGEQLPQELTPYEHRRMMREGSEKLLTAIFAAKVEW